MNLLLRLLPVVLRARPRPPLGPLDESVIHARVLPTGLDLNLHLNDVGELRRQCGNPVVGSATIRFRRPPGLWRRFAIHTRPVALPGAAVHPGQGRGGAGAGEGGLIVPRGRVLPQLVDASPWQLVSPLCRKEGRERVRAEGAIRQDAPRWEHEPIG